MRRGLFSPRASFPQIKAVDNGRPQKSSTCRLHIEWIPKPELPTDAAPLLFEEAPFSFSVMESDPVAHMVGVIATEASDVPVWFEITGKALPILRAPGFFLSAASECACACTWMKMLREVEKSLKID